MTYDELYNTLSEEVKEKVKACTSLEEMQSVLQAANINLDPRVLEGSLTDCNCNQHSNPCPFDKPCHPKLRQA